MEFHAKRSSAQGLLPIQCLAILIALFRVRLLAVYIKNHLFEAVISYTTTLQILNIKVHLLRLKISKQSNITIDYEHNRRHFPIAKPIGVYIC